MKKAFCVFAVIIALTVTSAFAQIPFLGGMPVFDATNFGNAVKRHFELVRQYEQLVLTYEQLIVEYDHFLYMAQRLPGLPRHRLGWTPWRFSRSANTYGTTGAWTSAVNTGTGVDPGYRQATEPLKVFGAALGNIPANQIERIKTDYATVELADAANLHGIEVIGSQRAKAPFAEEAIQALESASLSTDDRMNTHIAVLNKINAAGMMAVRASQDTNQLLVTLTEQQIAESKRKRDAEAAEIADHIAFRSRARLVATAGIRGSSVILRNIRMP